MGASAAGSHDVVYRIDVVTGSALGAGTDANIFCTLSGDLHRSSGEFHLKESRLHVNKFERGQVCIAAVVAARCALMPRCCAETFLLPARAGVGRVCLSPFVHICLPPFAVNRRRAG